MIDIKALEDSIHPILEPVVQNVDGNAVLIIEPNNAVVPNTSYASFKFINIDKVGFSVVGDVDFNGDVLVRSQYNISFRFSGFGPNSKNIIANLGFALTDNIIIHESLVSINLFQYNQPLLSDVPIFENTKWEERNTLTVSFHYAYEELIHVSLIEQVTLDGTYKDITNTIKLQTTQTITSP